MSDIFLSYSRADVAVAKRIAVALEKNGWSVWWDRQIPPGQTFDEVIERQLQDAKCVVVIWSRNSIASNWVKTEADEGLKSGLLVPILIDDAEPPLAFRRIQAASLVGWTGQANDSFHEVVAAIRSVMGVSRVNEANTVRATKAGWEVEEAATKSRWIRWPLVAVAVAVIVVSGIAVTRVFFAACDDVECRAEVTRLLDSQEDALLSDGYTRVVGGQWETQRLNDDDRTEQIIRIDTAAVFALIAACNSECTDLGVIVTGDNGLELASVVTDSSVAINDLVTEHDMELTVAVLMNRCSSQPCDYGLRLLSRPIDNGGN